MAYFVRHCPDCHEDSQFEQQHDRPGECPDTPDGDECPEWSCTACGAALLTGVISVGFTPAPDVALSRRVA